MEQQTKEIVVRYADIRGEGPQDYLKLTEEREYFVPSSYEETEEGLKLTFNQEGLISFQELHKENAVRKYAVLLKVIELEKIAGQFEFSLNPDNLYYSLTGSVKVLMRDIADDEEDSSERFLKEYKALAGAVLYRKYSYTDFLQGGKSLLKKKSYTEKFYYAESIGELQEYLKEKTEKEHEKQQKEQQLVLKRTQRFLKFLLTVFCAGTILGAGFAGYYQWKIHPYNQAVQNAMCAYIDKNYVELIDSMKNIELEQMNHYHKYILAEAYVNSENLSVEQKENILEGLTVNQNEKIFEYWIHIGRLNAVEAENIAMQLSDDELLLYAYLLDRDIIQKDTTLDGEEKKEKISELDDKIEEYTEHLMEEVTEDTTETE